MRIQRIWIHNFRSFTEAQSLAINKMNPGLYHISGINQVEPTLGANGAGKSSLFEALYWAFYGKTSRNVRAGNIINWDEKTAKVRIVTDKGTISRQQSPNLLELSKGSDVETVDQNQLEEMLGIGPDEFLQTSYFAQFNPCFIDLSPTHRMEIYSRVMKLDMWDEKAEMAKELVKSYAEDEEKIHRRVIRHTATLKALYESLEDLKSRNEEWEEAKTESLQRAQADFELAQNKYAELSKTLIEVKDHLAASEKEVKKLESREKENGAVVMEQGRNLRELELQKDRAEIALDQANSRLSDTIKPGSKCPTCGQMITAASKRKHKTELLSNLKLAKDLYGTKRFTLEKANTRFESIVTEVEQNSAELRKAEKLRDKLADRVERLELVISHQNEDLDRATYYFKRIDKESNPYATQISSIKSKIQNERTEQSSAVKERGSILTMKAAFEFWAKGFKDIRFDLIEESLIQLNAETNECLLELGLEGWRLEFSVEKETKKGTIRPGFHCDVINPAVVGSDARMPWESWSGGESQRLRLAAQLGISNMLSSRLGFECNLEMWDEPTTWLGEEGIKSLLSVLEERAKRYGRVILLADHRSIDYPFKGSISIVKNAHGSIIED
jgi:DNA repair exonuclease SbcCD ATPase subunit